MQKWEYIFIVAGRLNETWKAVIVNGRELKDWKSGPSLYDYINDKGEEGWELVSASFSPIFTQTAYVESDDYRLVMKRPKG
jgi:Domain of unknown function (DUF4177)